MISLSLIAEAAPRTFVASYGIDSNPCTITAPCRSFPAALMLTDSGGEIIVVDSAGYGAFATSQSVSVIAPSGVYAGISVLSGDGVSVVGFQINVQLRGLSVNGLGGTAGIHFQQGKTLTVQDCTIANMQDFGIRARAGHLIVDGTEVRTSGEDAIFIEAGAVTLERSKLLSNRGSGIGIRSDYWTVLATITESTIAGNSGPGVYAFANGLIRVAVDRSTVVRNNSGFLMFSPAILTVSRSVVSHNAQYGVLASGSASRALVAQSTIVGNEIGLAQSAGATLRSVANTIEENLYGPTSGTVTTATLK